MKAITIKTAEILVPNTDHKNFTASGDIIDKGTRLTGELKYVEGERRGEPFLYRLFVTKKGKLIYQNNIKPLEMETEILLGANALKAETPLTKEIILPNNAKFANAHIIGAVIGTIAGFAYAKKTKKTGKKLYAFAVVGALAGYVAGRVISGKPIINIKAPKTLIK